MAARSLSAGQCRKPLAVWSLQALAGRFVELTGPARLSMTAPLILEAQRRGDWAAWVGLAGSGFYPPDLAAAGVDLAALPVVRPPNASLLPVATEHLLRSASFALVVLDLHGGQRLPLSIQTRLTGLAQEHHTALVCLTPPAERCRLSLVSLRGAAARTHAGFDRFRCALEAVKDKRATPGWTEERVCHGPDGLC